MDGDRGPTCTAVGLRLLPSELLHEICLRLSIPDLHRFKSVSRSLSSLVSGDEFRRLYETHSRSGDRWIFVYKKRPPRDSFLRGFNHRSGRWFEIPIAGILAPPAVPPGEDLYLLAAAGDFFLFAANGLRVLLAVDLSTRIVRKIPASPLGPRGTGSWRRSGLKLLSGPPGSGRFRFVFAEMLGDRPVLFEYCSAKDAWRATEAAPINSAVGPAAADDDVEDRIHLHVGHPRRYGSETTVVSAARSGGAVPVFFGPRFDGGRQGRQYVYGDGKVAVVRSEAVGEAARVVTGAEVRGLGGELVGRVPRAVIEGRKTMKMKPYGVMMGCLEESREGVVRLVLMSNLRGEWDLTCLTYDSVSREWEWAPLPDCGTQGMNMAGMALSSSFAALRSTSI